MSDPGSNTPPVGIPVGLANSPFYVRETQNWAIDQERYRHDQALWTLGESAMFVLMWHVEDHQRGYVRRCPRCYENPTLSDAAKIYNQPTQNECPMCYGTSFEGGIRAKIIRPAIFTDSDDQERLDRRGATHPQSVSVETTSDFRYRNNDYVFRADGSRWQLAAPQRVMVRTGFGHPSQADASMGYAPTMATLEDRTSVAWKIPPNEDDLRLILSAPSRYPVSQTDLVNGDLIPRGYTD